MMCFGSREDVEAKRSKEIDALIHRDEKVMQRQVKLLLLGKLSTRVLHNSAEPYSILSLII